MTVINNEMYILTEIPSYLCKMSFVFFSGFKGIPLFELTLESGIFVHYFVSNYQQ